MSIDDTETVDWDTLVDTYTDQIAALIEGGVDAILIETIFDTLNAKAAGYAARRAMEKQGCRLPLMFSVTLIVGTDIGSIRRLNSSFRAAVNRSELRIRSRRNGSTRRSTATLSLCRQRLPQCRFTQ